MARIPTQNDLRIQRVDAPRGTPARTETGRDAAAARRPEATQRRPGGSAGDPFDIGGAIDRLRTLIAFDGGKGPRGGVPTRGFYLNILV